MARKKNDTKTCTKCGKSKVISTDKSVSEFYKDKSQKDLFAVWCKECERNYNRAYNKALKDANVSRKADIGDEKATAKFERTMRPERVVRKSKSMTNSATNTTTKSATKKATEKATTNSPRKSRTFSKKSA